jgi:hypothetical protein
LRGGQNLKQFEIIWIQSNLNFFFIWFNFCCPPLCWGPTGQPPSPSPIQTGQSAWPHRAACARRLRATTGRGVTWRLVWATPSPTLSQPSPTVWHHPIGWVRSESGMWKADTFKVVAPACVGYGPMGSPPWASVECTDRMMLILGPVILVAVVNRWLTLPPLLQWLARERIWIRTHGSVNRRAGDSLESPFSREEWPCSTLLMAHGRSVETVWRVGRVFPCRVYIDLNHRDSQI